MAGLRNKNAFKFILQVFILSQKHILGVKKVVWCGLDVVWGGLEVVWGGLGCFGVVWGVSTDRATTSRRHQKGRATRTQLAIYMGPIWAVQLGSIWVPYGLAHVNKIK